MDSAAMAERVSGWVGLARWRARDGVMDDDDDVLSLSTGRGASRSDFGNGIGYLDASSDGTSVDFVRPPVNEARSSSASLHANSSLERATANNASWGDLQSRVEGRSGGVSEGAIGFFVARMVYRRMCFVLLMLSPMETLKGHLEQLVYNFFSG